MLMIGVLLLQSLSACTAQTTQAQTPGPQSTTFARVSLPDSQVRQLKSSATGRSYDIYVLLPTDYAQNQKKYPTLYVLDGQWDFKLLDSIYGGLLYDGFIPEMIIVGITYSGLNPDYNALRAMDLTPVNDATIPGSGGASKFLAFIKAELIPFIESNYRADAAQRALMGSSFGGSFTLYALFSEPGLFSGYVAASPVVSYGDGFAFAQEAEYAKSHPDLPARLFVSVGGLEPLKAPIEEFMQVLSKRGYTGLELETRTIEGERHAGNKPEAFNRGLRFIFQGK
jgi:predicted alpha/beta superfamily hydrolase